MLGAAAHWAKAGLFVWAAMLALAGTCRLQAADEPGFTDSLAPSDRAATGLGKLTPAELAALNHAVEIYAHAAKTVAARQAAESAVTEYRRREEPKVVAQAVSLATDRQPGQTAER